MDISQLLSKQGLDPLQTSKAQSAVDSVQGAGQHDQLKAAAMNFEGVFVTQVLKQMQETIENASFDPEDTSNKQIHGMYCTFMSDMIAQQGGFGLWEKIYDQMVRMEGVQNQPGLQETAGSLDEKA